MAASAQVSTVVAAVVAAGALHAWGAAAPSDPSVAGALFAPRDGEVTIREVTGGDGVSLVVQEHLRGTGFGALSGLPNAVGSQILAAVDNTETDTLDVWRVTSRQVTGDTVGGASVDVFLLDEDGVHRAARFGSVVPGIFDPPLLVAPVETAVGERWSSSGDALFDGAVTYDYDAVVTDRTPDGCVTVRSSLALIASGEPFISIDAEERWCPGRALTDGTNTIEQDGIRERIDFVEITDPEERLVERSPPSPPEIPPADTPDVWEPDMWQPDMWRSVSTPVVMRDPVLGEMELSGLTAVPPEVAPDGLVVVALSNGDDVVGLRAAPPPDDADPNPRLVEQWRIHPGGDLLSVRILEDLVVVTTAERRLVVYDLDGVRRFAVDTDDLVLGGAIQADDDLVVVQDLSGRVTAWSVIDGKVRWRGATRADSDLAPVAFGDIVVAGDRSGDLVALDARTGDVRWRRTLSPIDALGVVGERIIIDTVDAEVIALGGDGDQMWSTRANLLSPRIDQIGDRVGLITDDETVTLDPADGSIEWRRAAGEWSEGWLPGLVVHERDRVCLYSPIGEEISCVGLGETSSAVRIFAVAAPTGIWSIDGTLRAHFIGPLGSGPP